MRKLFQGVFNIVRFNWHFYAIAATSVLVLCGVAYVVPPTARLALYTLCILGIGPVMLSLLASFYVYDLSGLYDFAWIEQGSTELTIVNINAGFDETSSLLINKLPHAKLIVLDFYDPVMHTEISIKRARKAYPPFPGTMEVSAKEIPLPDGSADAVFVIFSAHEIRNQVERIAFFKELRRIVKPSGKIYVMEHLRDMPNFLVYTIGFLHFYSKKSWFKIFHQAGFNRIDEKKITPFISIFTLSNNGKSR